MPKGGHCASGTEPFRKRRGRSCRSATNGAQLNTLIVERNADLGLIWRRFLERQGVTCDHVCEETAAYGALRAGSFDALVLDLEMEGGAAFRIADFASYRNPEIAIITVSANAFFADGAVFELIPNARGMLRQPLRLEDLAALVQHYGGRRNTVEDQTVAASRG
jgi:DNA-binding NtrC family response regulator